MAPPSLTLEERLSRHISKTENGCWEWTGGCNEFGYGILGRTTKYPQQLKAHRVAYELYVGPIPRFLFVLHSCDNPPCCNPDHLHLGDQQQNMKEAAERKRLHAMTASRCKRKHDYTVENTGYYRKNGKSFRYCRKCKMNSVKKYRKRSGKNSNFFRIQKEGREQSIFVK